MKLKHLLLSVALVGSSLAASAQSQGYLDGIEYFKAAYMPEFYDNAQTILERTIDAPETDRATALYYLGQIALKKGDAAKAEKLFNEGISVNPKVGLNYVGLGAIALSKGNVQGAREQFKAAVKAQNTAEVNVDVARAFYDADPVAYAKDYEKYMEAAFKKDKKNTDIYLMRGDKLMDEDQPGEAAAAYENAIYYNAQTPEAYVKYAQAYIHVNPKFAIDKLIELNNLAPNSAMAQRELAEKYYDNDQLTRAAQQYGVYIQNPNHFIQDEERYVQLLYFGGNYDQSYQLAQSILAKNPQSFSMHRMQFLNQAALKNYPQARTLAEKFFAMTPPANNRFTANDYTTFGDVLSELELDSLAIPQYEAAVAANPDKPELLKTLSSAYNNAKNYAGAADAFQRFIDAGDYKTNDLYILAGRYMSLAGATMEDSIAHDQAAARALEVINDVLAKVPDDYRIPQRKARILIIQNYNVPTEESAACYDMTLQLLDADPANLEKNAAVYREAYNMNGTYYVTVAKDNEKAREYYEKMYNMDPSNAALREYIDTKLK